MCCFTGTCRPSARTAKTVGRLYKRASARSSTDFQGDSWVTMMTVIMVGFGCGYCNQRSWAPLNGQAPTNTFTVRNETDGLKTKTKRAETKLE